MFESILLITGIAAWRYLFALLSTPSACPVLDSGVYVSASYKQRKQQALQDYQARLAVRQATR